MPESRRVKRKGRKERSGNPGAGAVLRPSSLASIALFLLLLLGGIGLASDNAAVRLDPDAFRAGFSKALRDGDAAALRRLAEANRDLLRPLAEEQLLRYSGALGKREDGTAFLELARALAELSFDLSGDDRMLRRTRAVQAWSAEEHARKSRADEAAAMAGTAFSQGRYGDVEAPARSALEMYASLKDESSQRNLLHILGQAERRLARYREAVSLHEKALELARRDGDRSDQGRALIDLGDVYERQKDQARAMELYAEAKAILVLPEDWREVGRALRQLGDIHVASGEFDRAYRAYREALSLAEGAGDSVLTSEFQDYLGYCQRRLGDFERGLEHHRTSLAVAGRIRDAGRRAAAEARAFNHMGLCLSKQAEAAVREGRKEAAVGLYREALAAEERSLILARSAQDRWRQGYVLRALSLLHRELGAILAGSEAERESAEALSRAEEALALARSMKEREWEGLALHEKALALLQSKRGEEGARVLDDAFRLWDEIGDLQSSGYAHWLQARRFLEAQGKLEEAYAGYSSAASSFGKIGDAESGGSVLLDQARIRRLQGRTDDAVRLYEEGLARMESVRAKAGLSEFKKAFMAKVNDRYEEAACHALENGLPEKAFRHAEGMRARVFLDQLAEGRLDLEKGIDPALKRRRDELEKKLGDAGRSLEEEYRRRPPDPSRIETLGREHDRISGELESLRREIRLANVLYASVQYPQPVTVAEVRNRVLRPGEVLLEYFLSPAGVYCFVVSKDGFEAVRLPIGEEALRKAVEALLENVESGVRRGEGFDRPGAAELYDALLRPMKARTDGKRILIAPDGILARLPFEALVVVEGDLRSYLLETNPVRYVQSASVLAMLREHYGVDGTNDGFVGFGDPVFDYDSFRAGRPETDGVSGGARPAVARFADLEGGLARLQASGDEVRAIGDIFRLEKRPAKELLRAEAREEETRREDTGRYGYIHFSTHGVLSPKMQSIVLSQIPDSPEDGVLTIGEIMNLRYRARLIVLSACQTGLGRIERGEGVTGLTRAFMYAGSPAVVVSLWSVDDIGTRELMVRFYEQMIRKGAAKDEALRAAKLELLKTRFRHPFFWSAFVMYGE